VKKERTEIKLNNAKLTTQLDYSMESSKVIEKNVVAYKQEISALRTKAEQYSNLVAKVTTNSALSPSHRLDSSRYAVNIHFIDCFTTVGFYWILNIFLMAAGCIQLRTISVF